MKQEDIDKVQERFEDLSKTIGTLRHWLKNIQSASSSLEDDLDSLESTCFDHASDCNDMSSTVNLLRHWLKNIQSACSFLEDDIYSLESTCFDYASDCNDMDSEPDIPEGWEEVIELLPPKPSVGDVLALKELVAKWRRDTYGEL